MKVSLKWLSDFVDVAEYFDKPEALADILTKAGLEVEEIQSHKRMYNSVLIGLILSKDKHPNSDKLSLCQVTTGEGVLHSIVCGAQNHAVNDRVVVALPGAKLPNGMSIGRSQVRGVDSAGMLCSDDELGLSTERADGIRILPADAPIGESFAKYIGLDDVTMELKVTPNRADCLSHYGLAREVSCLLNRPLKEIQPQVKEGSFTTQSKVTVDVVAPNACPRYCGRFIQGVKVAPSPDWLKRRLENVGLRSINNVVDVTNYVMMELGQPLHAFDAARIQSSKIIVSLSKAGEKLEALDGTQVEMKGTELLIRDGQDPVALAGVIGGKLSGVEDTTVDIFLESAYFDPSFVRKSSRAHGIQTDSAYRFSRGVNPKSTRLAMDRATELIVSVAGGEASQAPIDIYPQPIERKAIKMNIQTITDRLGYSAEAKTFESYCTRLGCEVVSQGEGQFEILPPSFRMDLESEMDFVEEYARLAGYDRIPETLPEFKQAPALHNAQYVLSRQLSRTLRASGFNEALSLAFAPHTQELSFYGERTRIQQLGLEIPAESVALLNPLSEEQNRLRAGLSFGLWKAVERNFHQGMEAGRLFEIGPVTRKTEKGYAEQLRLSLVVWGYEASVWKSGGFPLPLQIKQALSGALAFAGTLTVENLTEAKAPQFLHFGQAGRILLDGTPIGYLGSLHPVLIEEAKIRVPVAIAEVNIEGLELKLARARRYIPFSRMQAVWRDLSVVVTARTSVGAIESEIRGLKEPYLRDVVLFDLFTGGNLSENSKALGFRFQFQSAEATLKDEEVNASMDRIWNLLKEKFSAQNR